MSESWTNTTVGDLVARSVLKVSDGYRTRRDQLGVEGLPILRVADVLDGALVPSFKDHVRHEYRTKMGAKTSQTQDVLITTKGTVGRVAQVPINFPEHVYSPQLCFLRSVARDVVDPGWLYGWARSSEFSLQAGTHKDQTDMAPYISLRDLRRFRITLPPLREQRRIAAVLGAFDDLIDTNYEGALRCDALARALGQQLVSFADTAPTTRIENIAEITKGHSYKSADLNPGRGWLVNLKCVGRDGSFQSRGLKPFDGNAKDAQLIDNGDICVAQTDLTQKREVIGRPVRVRRGLATGDLVASLDLVIVRPRSEVTQEYLFAVLDSADFRSHALGYCNGTTVVHMASAAVSNYEVGVPDRSRMHAASGRIRALRSEADGAHMDAARLEAARDELLPRLISGRVRVRELAA